MKKKTKAKVIKKKLPLTKSLGELMKDEDGFVSKETILKVGLSTVAALGVAGALSDNASAGGHNNAGPSITSHTNVITTHNDNSSISSNCAQHTNVTTHTSY